MDYGINVNVEINRIFKEGEEISYALKVEQRTRELSNFAKTKSKSVRVKISIVGEIKTRLFYNSTFKVKTKIQRKEQINRLPKLIKKKLSAV